VKRVLFLCTIQGFNARKVISEVYASFVLQCTVTQDGCRSLTWDLHITNQWNILVIGNNYVNYQNLMLLTFSDTKQTQMHLFVFTNSAQRELDSICTQYVTAINFPCITTLAQFWQLPWHMFIRQDLILKLVFFNS